jgi:hypothetical protein
MDFDDDSHRGATASVVERSDGIRIRITASRVPNPVRARRPRQNRADW